MEKKSCSLYRDLANPCYSKRFIATKEVSAGSYVLFGHRTWRILIFVKKLVKSGGGVNSFLLVDICESSGCNVPHRFEDIYLCGVDIHLKSVEGKVFCIPFLRVGQGILLAEEIFNGEGQIRGLFYEINDMFILDTTKCC